MYFLEDLFELTVLLQLFLCSFIFTVLVFAEIYVCILRSRKRTRFIYFNCTFFISQVHFMNFLKHVREADMYLTYATATF